MDTRVEVRSPFLPGTNIQYAWDSTSLGDLKKCPRFYQYRMIEGWVEREESVHLRFGIEYHKALEEYDRATAKGEGHEDAVRRTLRTLLARTFDFSPDQLSKAGRYKSRRNLVQLVIDYLDRFYQEPTKTVILDDGSPAVELSFRFELDWGPTPSQPYLLCGHLDRVVEFSDSFFVMDRKTTTLTISEYWFNQWSPNNQMTLYSLASKVILGSPVKGVIVDGAQILLEKPNKFERGFTFRTEDQLDEWAYDLQYWFTQAEGYAEANYWPMNDTSCDKYGGCTFREVCNKSPSVRDRVLKGNFTQLPKEERWNPLRSR